MAEIKKVGVLGCGLMGSGIAEMCAAAGYETVVREVSDELVDKGIGGIRGSLGKAVEKGKLEAEDRDAALGRLCGTVGPRGPRRLRPRDRGDRREPGGEERDLRAPSTRLCQADAIFASNTSSLTITQIAMATKRPDQLVGLHFFNPVPVMKLVEVVRTIAHLGRRASTRAFEFARSLGKEPIACRDNSGFVVNRLLVPYAPGSVGPC